MNMPSNFMEEIISALIESPDYQYEESDRARMVEQLITVEAEA